MALIIFACSLWLMMIYFEISSLNQNLQKIEQTLRKNETIFAKKVLDDS